MLFQELISIPLGRTKGLLLTPMLLSGKFLTNATPRRLRLTLHACEWLRLSSILEMPYVHSHFIFILKKTRALCVRSHRERAGQKTPRYWPNVTKRSLSATVLA